LKNTQRRLQKPRAGFDRLLAVALCQSKRFIRLQVLHERANGVRAVENRTQEFWVLFHKTLVVPIRCIAKPPKVLCLGIDDTEVEHCLLLSRNVKVQPSLLKARLVL
jgi:hypothetical protein